MAILFLTIHQLLLSFPWEWAVNAKELVATHEWQQVKEGDTIPKGLHVRMDFETGTKWVKLLDEQDEDQVLSSSGTNAISTMTNNVDDLKVSERQSKGPKVTQLTHAQLTPEASAKITNTILEQEQQRTKNYMESVAALNDFEKGDEHVNELDYETMYRALQSLPVEDLQEMGMMLPPSLPSKEEGMSDQDFELERVEFEHRVKEIWSSRQDLLKRMEEEHLANIPDILQERIRFLESYIVSPVEYLTHALQSCHEQDTTDDICSVLQDLEFHVMDMDMARDFHTMGGLPLLASLLTDKIHGLDLATEEAIQWDREHGLNTSIITSSDDGPSPSKDILLRPQTLDYLQQMQEMIWNVQSLACWVIGTAVKNTEEFWDWALEDFSEFITTPVLNTDNAFQEVNLISILTSRIQDNLSVESPLSFIKLRQKELYALGSLLRGNRKAIHYFNSVEGPKILGQSISPLLSQLEALDSQTSKIIAKTVVLADDLIMDVVLHPTDDFSIETNNRADDSIISSFTTDAWCSLPVSGIKLQSPVIKRQMLQAIVNLTPYCSYDKITFKEVQEAISEHRESDDFISLNTEFQTIVEYTRD